MNCPLCEAEHLTSWLYEDEACWIAFCRNCRVPMVVARIHGSEVPPEIREHMIVCLAKAAREHFGRIRYRIDTEMRQIKDHAHFHARAA